MPLGAFSLTSRSFPHSQGVGNGILTEVSTEELSVDSRERWAVLERERELAELEGLIAAARESRGRVLLIEGPAGIGKTRLLEAARERAGAVGMSVLAARGGDLERDFGFGVVRQLLEPALAAAAASVRGELLAGAAGLARPVFAAVPGATGDPSHAVLHGLYWLVANLCERSPVLIAVDDVHWADRPSLRFLIHLARRLDGLPAAIALASRTGEERPDQTELVKALVLEARPPVLRPHPLSERAVRQVVEAGMGEEAGPLLAAACREATGGNPFLLTELVEQLRRDGRRPAEISPAAVQRLTSERIAAALLLRIGRLDRRAPGLARAVAVLGSGASLPRAAALAGLDPDQAARLAAALVDADVLRPGVPLGFVHPLVRASVYDDIAWAERASLHRRAAELLAGEVADPEAIALQLLSTGPAGEAWVVSALRAAARAAVSRGAAEVAARYLRRALEEPPSPTLRPGLLLELGSAAARAGESEGLAWMRSALELAAEPRTRTEAGLELGKALLLGARAVGEGVLVLERALENAADPKLAVRVEALLLLGALTTTSAHTRFAARLREARPRVERLPEEEACLLLPLVAMDVAVSDGTAAEAAALAERALTGGVLLREQVESDLPLLYPAVWVLIHTDRLEAGRRALREAAAETRTRGSPLGLATVSAFEALALQRAGELASAEAAARASLELTIEAIGNPIATAALVAVLVERGELREARTLLERLDGTYDPEVMPTQILRESRARLRMAEGDPHGALAELRAVARWEQAWAPCNGILPVPWRSATALAHTALGDTDTARELAEEELALARRFGAPRPVGVALRALGLIQSPDGGELLGEAVSVLEGSAARLEHARALLDLGAALRRSGRRAEAREQLAQAMDLAHRCGAAVLVDRAHDELARAGARPRRPARSGLDALTPSERRVAELAADGKTNKEIAQALFVTLRTVEMHLTNAYRKLGISSRRALDRTLRAERRDNRRRG
jgi:DNA-binding CsgD family transcriptional regulator/Flp pilus assembly protein TadD